MNPKFKKLLEDSQKADQIAKILTQRTLDGYLNGDHVPRPATVVAVLEALDISDADWDLYL